MKEILIIDGNSLLYRAYFATAVMGNLMVNKDGIPTNAVYSFANMLEKLLQKQPEYVMVAFDCGKKTFRNDLMENYKGTRKETPDELVCQFPIVREYLQAHHIVYEEIEGYEGDDLIGTLTQKASQAGFKVSIVTGDKDMLQLVNEQVTVYRTIKSGVSEMDEMTPQTVEEKFEVKPSQIRDLLGLMGDSADNIPGIKGIGIKTAVKLLKTYTSIEGIDAHKEEIKGKLGQNIQENIQDAYLSKQIATIMLDVPMNDDLQKYHYEEGSQDDLLDFYRRYDMNSFIKKTLMKTSTVKSAPTTMQIVETMPEITQESALVVGVYDVNYHKSIILGFGLYHEDRACFISYEHALKDERFKAYLKDPSKVKYGYDIKRCYNACRWNHIDIEGYQFDLQLATYILNPGLKDDMKYVCDYYHYDDIVFEEQVFGKGAKRQIPDIESMATYYVQQAKAIYVLRQQAIEQLQASSQYHLYQDVELPVAHILANMEYAGVKVDLNVLKQLEKDMTERISLLEKQIHQEAQCEFNIASPKQLGEVLFEKLKLPNGKKTKTGYSTSADVLEKLKPYHPIVEHVLDYRTLTKLYSTYVLGLQDQCMADGKIHTIYTQTLTQTGRLSSIEPNLQNIPVRYEEGKMIRKAFVPSLDYLVSFDYSQIELRVLASLAHVSSLIQAFNEDKDIHRHTASEIFEVKEEDVTPQMRYQSKAVNFGIIYGMSDFGLSEQIGVSVNQAKLFIQRYFTQYPEIKVYMDQQIELAKKQGYVETILHRRRYIPEMNEKNYMVRELGKRLAMNTPIQGSAADILKLAMIKVDAKMKEKQLQSKMILQVHDELIFDVKKEELEVMMNLIKEGMEEAVTMSVVLKAEGTYASNWYDLK